MADHIRVLVTTRAFIQTVFAGWVFLQILSRRHRLRGKTVKKGFVATSFFSDGGPS